MIARAEKVKLKARAALKIQERIFNIRLLLVLGTLVALTVFVIERRADLSLAMTLIAIVCFYILWKQSKSVRDYLADLTSLGEFYSRMVARKNAEPLPHFSKDVPATARERDLDLVGPLSVLSQLSECFSQEAQAKLRALLNQEVVPRDAALNTQTLWLELKKRPGVWRRWLVKGHVNAAEFGGVWDWKSVTDSIAQPFLPGRTPTYLILLLVLNIAFWVRGIYEMNSHSSDVISLTLIGLYWIGTMVTLGQTGNGYSRALGVQSRLLPLLRISRESQRAVNSSPVAVAAFPVASSNQVERSGQQMEAACTLLSTASHPVIFILFNALVPWTLIGCWWAERARVKLALSVAASIGEWEWLEILASFAMIESGIPAQVGSRGGAGDGRKTESLSAGGQDYDRIELRARGLVHPLLAQASAVGADLDWTTDVRTVILTGSNMAGKSTFLRALGINFQLAQIGAPVFAREFSTFSGQLMSSIRTTDSLGDGASYFYSEVARIKKIVDEVSDGRPVLYVIDEMFRGTNTQERINGCGQILSALAKFPSAMGVVATHDLELAVLSFSGLSNFHFREEVVGNKMNFSYRLEAGICPTTNAIRVMHSMGLPVSLAGS